MAASPACSGHAVKDARVPTYPPQNQAWSLGHDAAGGNAVVRALRPGSWIRPPPGPEIAGKTRQSSIGSLPPQSTVAGRCFTPLPFCFLRSLRFLRSQTVMRARTWLLCCAA